LISVVVRHDKLLELSRRRSNLSLHLHFHVLQKLTCFRLTYPIAGDVTTPPGLTLRCWASKLHPLVIIAQRMRAFLLAIATAAFCHPDFSRNLYSHFEMGSSRLCAVNTADLAPCISKLRNYMSPRLVILPRLFFPPLEFCLGVNPSQAPNCAPFLNCLKSPTVATTADAVTGPTPVRSLAAFA